APWTYPLSLHDALPILRPVNLRPSRGDSDVPLPPERLAPDEQVADSTPLTLVVLALHSTWRSGLTGAGVTVKHAAVLAPGWSARSEEHTSELQSLRHLV